MKKRTMREWTDFTGWYATKQKPNKNAFISTIYYLHENKPDCIDMGNQGGFWIATSGWSLSIPLQLVAPFEGDWKDSLHSPRVPCPECNGTGKSTEHDRDYPPNYYTCPTCQGTGTIEGE